MEPRKDLSRRDMGKSLFADIKDSTANIQVYVQKQARGEEQFTLFKQFIDLGDIVGAIGSVLVLASLFGRDRTPVWRCCYWAQNH